MSDSNTNDNMNGTNVNTSDTSSSTKRRGRPKTIDDKKEYMRLYKQKYREEHPDVVEKENKGSKIYHKQCRECYVLLKDLMNQNYIFNENQIEKCKKIFN